MNGPDEYDQLVARSFMDYSPQHRNLYLTIAALLRDYPADILEVGAGIGYGYKVLRDNGCIKHYTAIEPSHKCCKYLAECYDMNIYNCNFDEFVIDEMSDFSLCIEVIEHVEDINLLHWFARMYGHTKIASFISTPDKRTDPHGVFTKEEVQDALYEAGYSHVVKIEWQLPHTLFIAEV